MNQQQLDEIRKRAHRTVAFMPGEYRDVLNFAKQATEDINYMLDTIQQLQTELYNSQQLHVRLLQVLNEYFEFAKSRT